MPPATSTGLLRPTWHAARDDALGIERVRVTPEERRFDAPLLFVHGMWHGAWCWRHWQELFARWGWESVAFSLPGHGGSPARRSLRWCTMGYYQQFLDEEIRRLERPPVVVGHSMGGGLVQRLLERRDDLPAAVMLTPYLHRFMIGIVLRHFRLDFWGAVQSVATLSVTPVVRKAALMERLFLGEDALISAEDLHARLGPEPMLPLLEHNWPLWRPRTSHRPRRTPVLWVGAERDAILPEPWSRHSATRYGAQYWMAPEATHDLMFRPGHAAYAAHLHHWLERQPAVA